MIKKISVGYFSQIFNLLVKLAIITHSAGVQSKRLEQFLSKTALALGCVGEFIVLPNQIFMHAYSQKTNFSHTKLLRVGDAALDINKIIKISALIWKVQHGQMNVLEASNSLDQIDKSLPYYSVWTVSIGYLAASAGFAGFLQCNYISILLSAVLGVIVYLSSIAMKRYRLGYFEAFLSASLIGLIAGTCSFVSPELNPYLISLSAIIYLIPGFTISSGIIEISYKYTLSGFINLVNGVTYLVTLFSAIYFSVLFCQKILVGAPIIDHQLLSQITDYKWISAVVMSMGFSIIFQIPKREFLWVSLAIVLMIVSILFAEKILSSPNFGNILAAFICSIYSAKWSNKCKKPESIILLPGIVFLVSGSVGFRGVVSLSQGDYILALHQTCQMFMVAVCIAVGLVSGKIICNNRSGSGL
ncbi:threonine/serine exporter family protein [Cysteiniphilum halobium]|uniref:threonine/serine exporter family protein n=1 Tax=Cysteiniphilum halobium TaxID=2219059 RepID=UPI000E657F40|nr:threonine/serine exporter family protein [Cysteiniphilum halobium]